MMASLIPCPPHCIHLARRLALELRTEVESSRALLSNSKNGTSGTCASSGSGSGSGYNRDGDNQAVRRLYEDLTGIVISRIELCEREEGDDANSERRRYTGAYAAVGHHGEYKMDRVIAPLRGLVLSIRTL